MELARQKIRYMRMVNRLSIQRASEIAGITIHQWKHFESKGRTMPKFFKQMCETVGLEAEQLLKEEGWL